MMKFGKRGGDSEEELFQITAMVDVVFILLAFFVLAARFQPSERDVGLEHREQASPAARVGEDLPSAIPVYLGRSGTGGVVARVGQVVLPENDYQAITAKLMEIDMPELPVVLMVEPELSVEVTARALDAILQSPMKNISLAEAGGKSGGPG